MRLRRMKSAQRRAITARSPAAANAPGRCKPRFTFNRCLSGPRTANRIAARLARFSH